jgi:hypothetical protein
MHAFVCLLWPVLHFFLTRARTFLFLHTPTMLSTTINNTLNTHTHTGTAMDIHTTTLRILELLIFGTVGGIWLVSNCFFSLHAHHLFFH